jgi:hypothetical protein
MNDRIRVKRLRRERDLLRHINNDMAGELSKLAGELSKLRAALERIAANTCCDKGQEAALVAREVLRVTSIPTVSQVALSESPQQGVVAAGGRAILASVLPVALWRRLLTFCRWSGAPWRYIHIKGAAGRTPTASRLACRNPPRSARWRSACSVVLEPDSRDANAEKTDRSRLAGEAAQSRACQDLTAPSR